MSGTGTVTAVDRASDRDGARVWRLMIEDGPGNADARVGLAANRTVTSDMPAHVAIDMPRPKDVSETEWAVCPMKAGDVIAWGPHHIAVGGMSYPKVGFEYDWGAPLSPP